MLTETEQLRPRREIMGWVGEGQLPTATRTCCRHVSAGSWQRNDQVRNEVS